MRPTHVLLLGLLALFLTTCAPIPASAPTAGAQQGGTVTLALSQEPDILNPYLASQRAAGEVHTFIVEGLLGVDAHGSYFPVLATDVPTKENGGVSADGLTITYHLKPDVTWSDGQPFTCDDVLFTWQVVVNPKSGAVGTTGYSEIDSITCPDPHTAVLRFRTFYAAYLVPFWAVLPRHVTGEPAGMTKWDYNRNPVGTGPFVLKEWVSGDHITLVPNPRYRVKGLPNLDSVVIRFVPSRDVALQLLTSGQVDIVGDLAEANLPQLAQTPGVTVSSAPGPRSERLLFNLADPAMDTPPDPAHQPHPILADARVREALELAIDKQALVNQLLYGQANVGTNELNTGWAKCDTPPSEFNRDKARQLLDQAGWVAGADGIRVAQGARYAKDGTRLRLKLQGPSGDSLREQVEQVLLDWWKQIGVEAYIENAPTAALFGTFESGGIARHGKFDILIYTTGLPIPDPQSQVETYFSSWNIPLPTNKGAGYNYSRWIDTTADQAIRAAGSTADLAARRAAYCTVMSEVTSQRPQIYLYARKSLAAFRNTLQGWEMNVWKNLGWNAAQWRLK